MTLLGSADNRHSTFGEGPGDTDLRARQPIFGADFLHGVRQSTQLSQDGIIFLPAFAVCRERILYVVFAGESTLLQNHVCPELDAILFAVVQDTAFLRGTVEQAEVVLYGRNLESGFAQDFIGAADLIDVVIGDTNFTHLAGLEQGNQPRSPTFHIHRVVDPIHVDIIQPHPLQGGLGHLGHAVVVDFGQLRGEFGRNEHVITLIGRCQVSQNPFRFAHAIGRRRVPQVETGFHGGIKDRFQVAFIRVASKDGVSAEHTCAPGPGSKCYF